MEVIDRLFINIGSAFSRLLTDTLGLPQEIASVIGVVAMAFAVSTFAAVTFLVLTYLERKVVARIQDRIGPNRVGPFGLLQPFADAIKMFTKEQTMPEIADRVVFQIAPVLAAAPSLMLFAVIPFGRDMIPSNLDVGLIYIIAIGSFAEIAILMGGWASRNKYSLLGAMRAAAQMLSYEIPMVLSLLGVVLLTGSLRLNDIVEAQQVLPFILLQPVAFLTFLLAGAAEVGRSPFDTTEAESELVAGYHTEYAGMQFGLFQMGEFLGFYAQSAIATTIFLGGWQGPAFLPSWLWFWLKTWLIVFIFQWAFRGTFPRLRIDQLQAFCWKFLVPAMLLNMFITGFLAYFFPIVRVADGVRQLVPAGVPGWLTVLAVYLIANFVTVLILAVLYRGEVRRSVAQYEARVDSGAAPAQRVDSEAVVA